MHGNLDAHSLATVAGCDETETDDLGNYIWPSQQRTKSIGLSWLLLCVAIKSCTRVELLNYDHVHSADTGMRVVCPI